MITDRIAEQIARDILTPFIKIGVADEEMISSAVKIIKARVDQDEAEKRCEEVRASIQVHTFIVDALKGLKR